LHWTVFYKIYLIVALQNWGVAYTRIIVVVVVIIIIIIIFLEKLDLPRKSRYPIDN
jgi:hypothetical protein